MFYALTDNFVGSNPQEYTHGFANTKGALAFRTKAERTAWLNETRLLTAKAITRAEALKLAERSNGYLTDNPGDKVVPIYGTETEFRLPEYHVIRKA